MTSCGHCNQPILWMAWDPKPNDPPSSAPRPPPFEFPGWIHSADLDGETVVRGHEASPWQFVLKAA